MTGAPDGGATTEREIDWNLLRERAAEAMRRAYAPYSNFPVGAAALVDDGRVVVGCNVENASYGLTMCAERVAVFKAVSEGIREFDAVAVVADSPRLAPPCGPCRQILWEFCGDIWVHLEDMKGHKRTFKMAELMPYPFDDKNL
jgi:cytidine deaminase